jgi:hypothetical protein
MVWRIPEIKTRNNGFFKYYYVLFLDTIHLRPLYWRLYIDKCVTSHVVLSQCQEQNSYFSISAMYYKDQSHVVLSQRQEQNSYFCISAMYYKDHRYIEDYTLISVSHGLARLFVKYKHCFSITQVSCKRVKLLYCTWSLNPRRLVNKWSCNYFHDEQILVRLVCSCVNFALKIYVTQTPSFVKYGKKSK